MEISIIIPTYNRASILKKCLEALNRQTLNPKNFEVIVVNDGGEDNTPKVLEKFKKKPWKLTGIEQKNAGQGKARNHGLKYAKGRIILLLGDDILLEKHALEEHLKSHTEHPKDFIAVLGFIDWAPDLKVNDYMRWMVNGSSIFGKFGGHQFAFEKLERGEKPNFNFFYTSNISLKRNFLGKNPFDLAFSNYGWEDIDLGYRLEKEKGMKMIYNKKAIGYHDHAMDESGLAKRMEMIGRSAHIIHQKHPELQKVPKISKRFIFWMLSNSLSLAGIKALNRMSKNRFKALEYYVLSKKYFIKGLKSGIITDKNV